MARGDERHTGADALISIPNGNEIPVSNVSWDREVNTTDVQQGGLEATIAVTGLRYSGSFEYDGKNEDLRDQLWNNDGTPVRTTLSVIEYDSDTDSSGRKIVFSNVIVTGESRDVPSDDVSSTSWDFSAEGMNVTDNLST